MPLDLRVIRQARVLSEHGSFSRAADALGIAQPTLSRSIKELEDTLGLKLFSRGRHGVEPTDFGHLFLQHAASVSAQVADLEREVALAKGLGKGEVSAAFGPYPAEALVPGCLRRFVAAHPTIRIRIQLDAIETHGRALKARTIDLVVGEASVLQGDDAIEVIERLAPIRAFMLVRTGHPLATATRVTLADVVDHPFVQLTRMPPRALKPLLGARRRTRAADPAVPFPAIECPTLPLGVSAIIDSDAVLMAPLGAVRRELEAGRVVPVLHEPWMRSDWAVMRLRGRTLGPAATAFVEALKSSHQAVLEEEATLNRRWADRSSVPKRRDSSAVRRTGRKKP